MIDRVTGTVVEVSPGAVVLDVGGIGVRVEVTPQTAEGLGRLGERLTLLTTLSLVGAQDPQPRLFGFTTAEARALFLLLRGVSGIGPSTALRLLGAQRTPADVAAAIAQGDAGAIKVKGVGPKIAKRVVTELKDKVGAVLQCMPMTASRQARRPAAAARTAYDDALLALRGLEFDPQRARELLDEASGELDADAGVEDLVRAALLRA